MREGGERNGKSNNAGGGWEGQEKQQNRRGWRNGRNVTMQEGVGCMGREKQYTGEATMREGWEKHYNTGEGQRDRPSNNVGEG